MSLSDGLMVDIHSISMPFFSSCWQPTNNQRRWRGVSARDYVDAIYPARHTAKVSLSFENGPCPIQQRRKSGSDVDYQCVPRVRADNWL